jgi:drug/metabolite transporter (DMT)-like permease
VTTADVTAALVTSVHVPLPHPGLSEAGKTVEHYLDQVDIPTLSILLSLAGAGCYAVSSILQQAAAAAQPPEVSMRPSLLLRLVRSGRWMLGILADAGGFVMQFLALRAGSLALVTPLFVTGLAFSILGQAFVQGRHPNRREWLGSGATVLGLGLFVGLAQPGPGNPHASALGWGLLFATTGVLTAIAIGFARGTARRRALMLSVATGLVYGVTAAITEHAGHVLDHGFIHALGTWTPYVLAVISIFGLLINQSAYQAGDLRWSLPLLTVLEPIVAILIGQYLFGEHISSAPGARVGALIGLIVMVVGVFWLTGSVTDHPPASTSPPERGAPATASSGAVRSASTATTANNPAVGNPAAAESAATGSATPAPP